jgi:hypothetical protein
MHIIIESSHQCQRRPLALSGLSPLPPFFGSCLLCAWVSGVSTLHGREAKIEHGKNGALKETDKREKAAAKSLSFHRQRWGSKATLVLGAWPLMLERTVTALFTALVLVPDARSSEETPANVHYWRVKLNHSGFDVKVIHGAIKMESNKVVWFFHGIIACLILFC